MKLIKYVGNRQYCNENEYLDALKGNSVKKIDLSPIKGNVTIDFSFNEKAITSPYNGIFKDLLDVAVCVYIADEIISRNNAGDGWTRDIELILPALNSDMFIKHNDLFTDILNFLSGDNYSLTWLKQRKEIIPSKHRGKISGRYNAVCLFSGGIDSFTGAYNLLKNGAKVLLVGHNSDGITSNAQKTMFRILKEKFGKNVNLLQAYIARSKKSDKKYLLPDKVEDSHRTRSFLFLVIAVGIANAVRVNKVYVPENGIIALNAPLTLSRIGSLSTRTVHPRFLSSFILFLAKSKYLERIQIINPFVFHSKTEVVNALPKEMHEYIRQSVSCSHAGAVRWKGKKGIRHCGYCIPCIYRRLALLEIGRDVSSDYIVDVFKDFSKLTLNESADLLSFSIFMKKVNVMSPMHLNSLITSHGSFNPNVGGYLLDNTIKVNNYKPWASMLVRYAKEVIGKFERVLSDDAKEILDY